MFPTLTLPYQGEGILIPVPCYVEPSLLRTLRQ